jgi:hypothetical protein
MPSKGWGWNVYWVRLWGLGKRRSAATVREFSGELGTLRYSPYIAIFS